MVLLHRKPRQRWLLAGCATTTQVTDFTDRSVGYGWLNIKDVEANRLHDVSIYQFRPHTTEPYYPAALKEFKGGYLYWTMALPNGAHKTISASGPDTVAPRPERRVRPRPSATRLPARCRFRARGGWNPADLRCARPLTRQRADTRQDERVHRETSKCPRF